MHSDTVKGYYLGTQGQGCQVSWVSIRGYRAQFYTVLNYLDLKHASVQSNYES